MPGKVPSSDTIAPYYIPLIETLRELSGSGKSTEVRDRIIVRMGLTEADLAPKYKDGSPRVYGDIHFARYFLKRRGVIDSSERGVWRLTPLGMTVDLNANVKELPDLGLVAPNSVVPADDVDEPLDPPTRGLLETLLSLSPSGFERLCQRVLRESGFSEVHVTGKTGDGGIDGDGILQLNELVSFRVLFQCKRYQGAVGPSVVRELQGAMQGRADKGLVLTTGTFTRAAKEESQRPGGLPVELVDGERLVALMERLGLGVKPRTVYDVEEAFFAEYR